MENRLRYLPALACVGACLVAATATSAAAPGNSVAAFYYPWYGTPARDGAPLHWRTPHAGSALAAGFVPLRGEYSSSDPSILAAHMQDLHAAKVDTVIVSWWGAGSIEDRRLPLVVAAARARGIEVALHVEPYPGRTPLTVEADVRRLAHHRIRDVYVYDSSKHDDSEWAAVNARLKGFRLFANTPLAGKAHAGRFAGLYTYDVLVYDGRSFRRMCRQARALGLVCAPSVGPGFDARRATGETRVRERRDGRTYDSMWRHAVGARADIVTITSYNEWHEGTQIEPARAGYDGAFGEVGVAAETAYLARTAGWADAFRARRGQ